MTNDDKPFEYNQLDPNIQAVVYILRDAGFRTTDSGDGSTKPDDHEGVIREPHVFITIDNPQRIHDRTHSGDVAAAGLGVLAAHRIHRLFRARDVSFDPDDYDDPTKAPRLEVTYGYPDRFVLVALFGVTDDMLLGGRRPAEGAS